ncbi:hypothetical protein HMPREF0731_1942, partial [Pseudoroseomonas cervicalis ATCC 49957]
MLSSRAILATARALLVAAPLLVPVAGPARAQGPLSAPALGGMAQQGGGNA